MTANESSSVPAVGGDKEQQQEAASLAFPVQQCYRSIAHVEHGFMLGRRRYQCPGKESNDAPSPPAPPAATDDEATGLSAVAAWLGLPEDPDLWTREQKQSFARSLAETDDEAALAVIADAAHAACPPISNYTGKRFVAEAALAALHAQGYRIVRDD